MDALKHLMDTPQLLALELTDTMTRQIQVPPALMDRVRAALGTRQAVELAGVIAAYNMVSRFLEATGIHAHDVR